MKFETELDTVVLAILIAGLMPVICAGIAKWGFKNFDNHNPRAWLSQLDGLRARANAAQNNCFEAFPFFAVGAILAALAGADSDALEYTSWFFVLIRVAYIACYLANQATLRTLCWIAGYASVVYLYVLALY